MTTGSGLREHIQIQCLTHCPETNAFNWKTERNTWAAVEQDTRKNLFSSIGIGARGLTFTLRRNPRLTLHNTFLWRGQFCVLTAITDGAPGFQTVRAALAEPAILTAEPQDRKGRDALNRPSAIQQAALTFLGILTEKYIRNEAEEVFRTNLRQRIPVTPKAILLRPGDLVRPRGESPYTIRQTLDLDPWKNEYVLERQEDV